jgi:serine/threonine protein kinase
MSNERPLDALAGLNATTDRPRAESTMPEGPGHTLAAAADQPVNSARQAAAIGTPAGPGCTAGGDSGKSNVPFAGGTSGVPSSFGGYEILGEIARGGMGVVYKAKQTSLGRLVALKLIQGEGLTSDTSIRRFLQEARAAAALDHPNIVPIYECGQELNQPYYAMAFIDGRSLTALVRERGTLPADEAIRLLLPVIEAVDLAHKHGIIHRDLKPDNVLIDNTGRPRITDFGLAKVAGGETDMTRTGNILGTPKYMSPEQAQGCADIGPPCDVYALGGILYYMLTGQPPVVGESLSQVVLNVVTALPPSPRKLNPNVPRELSDVCLKCLAKSPEDRYFSAAALADALRPMVDPSMTRSASSRTVATAAPSSAKWSRKWLMIAAAVAVIAAAVVLVIIKLNSMDRNSQAGNDPTKDDRKNEKNPDPTKDDRKNEQEPNRVLSKGPDARKLLLPITKRDINVKVRLAQANLVPDADGIVQVPAGTAGYYTIEVSEDAYVAVFTIDPQGNIVQLFPNDTEQEHFFKKNKPETIPRVRKITAQMGEGVELIRVLASTTPWKPNENGERVENDFRLFKTGVADDAEAKQKRGFVLVPIDANAARMGEAELPYRVVPKP